MDSTDLATVSLFANLTAEDRERMANQMREIRLPEGEVITEQGDLSFKFFVLLEGTATVTKSGRHVDDLRAGDFFGEEGILEKQHRNAEVLATSPVRLAVLASWDFRTLLEEFPKIRYQVQQARQERTES